MAAGLRSPVRREPARDATGGSDAPAGFRPDLSPEGVPLRVESIAAGGDGVTREPDGRVVFVPRTAPGDRVRVRIDEERERWARGRPVELLASGPDRIRAPCRYYDACGGCQVQHLSASAQRAAKRQVVADALQRIGGRAISVAETLAAGPEFGYRNRVTFTLRRGPGGRVTAGYRRFDAPGEVLDVERCPLAEPPIRTAWKALREGWGDGASLLPAGPELRVTLRASAFGRVGLVIHGGDPDRPGRPAGVAEAVESLATYHWVPDGGPRRRVAGHETLEERWAGLHLRLRPEAFVQVNREVSDAMDRHLDARAGSLSGRRVLDLYAGVGVRAIRWARAGAAVTAVDAAPDAIATGREAAAGSGQAWDGRGGHPEAGRVAFRRARVEDCLEALLPADLAVVNPPRAGLSRSVARRLARGGVSTLAYVSCDPATLARDLARLGDGWRTASVQPFDAFPQTAHVETIVWLEREREALP